MIASERSTRRVCCFNFLLVRLWHHHDRREARGQASHSVSACAGAYAGGRMIPSAPALPPPPVRYLESLAVSCHVCSGRRLHPALLPEFQVSAGRSRQPSSWGDLETCPPVPVLKKTIRQNLPSSPRLQLRLRSYGCIVQIFFVSYGCFCRESSSVWARKLRTKMNI